MRSNSAHFVKSLLNSYAIVFFSQSRLLGALLLMVSLFDLTAGLSGLFCASLAVIYANCAKYDKAEVEKGLFSFNALLLGIGLGTFYHINAAFVIWLVISCFLCIVITINLKAWLDMRRLPYLSLPFIITFWLILSAANSIFQMGLHQNSSAILNELNDAGNMHSPDMFGLFKTFSLPYYPGLFFKGLSAVFFQNSAVTGLLMAIGIFIWSRIAFSTLVVNFAVVIVFNHFTGIYPEGISHYHLGSNFMITAMGVGSFFLVPSWRSYAWAAAAVLFTFLLVNAFTRLIGAIDLPVLSLPFCVVSLLLLVVFKKQYQGAGLTPVQFYSPEKNLYQVLNYQLRLKELKYFSIQLPFMGEWLVSQGYDGDITHKNEWGQALDFVITDEDQKTYQLPGTGPGHYYAYGKPVLACADGIVVGLVDYIDDNLINDVNLKDNWGNTIVIKHADELYSKVSHLKKGSAKVQLGDQVKQGSIIALCGNSGRSPEPHLHFQLQATPYIGSKTITYPIANYISGNNARCFAIPKEGEKVSPVLVNSSLKKAFGFQPGYVAMVQSDSGEQDVFEVYTDSRQQNYFHSKASGAVAYFMNSGTAFYFTAFYGNESSLLYHFYVAAYKVTFVDAGVASDTFPFSSGGFKPGMWLQDLIAPFYCDNMLQYRSECHVDGTKTIVKSTQQQSTGKNKSSIIAVFIVIENSGIQSFTTNKQGNSIEVKWTTGNI